MFPETHQITPQSTISVQTYNEAASLLEQTLNITVPWPQKIDMEFMSEKLFDILQYDSTKFHTAEEREQASQQKYAAQLLMEQVRFNRTQIEHNHSNTNQNTQQVHQENIEITNQNKEKKPIISIQEEFKEIMKEPTIQKITPPTQQQKIEEKVEATPHPDLEIFEKNIKILVSWLQSTDNEKIESGRILQNLTQQHLWQESVDVFKEHYINTTTWNFRLQKISVDYTMKSITKTPLQQILSELKNKLS